MHFFVVVFSQIGELRSGSPRLVELNDYIRHLHKKGVLQVLSFCEVTDLQYLIPENFTTLCVDMHAIMCMFFLGRYTDCFFIICRPR